MATPDRDIDDGITRVAAVRHPYDPLGHATGSLLFLLAGGSVWPVGNLPVLVRTVTYRP